MDPETELAELYAHLVLSTPTALVVRLRESLGTLVDYERAKEVWMNSGIVRVEEYA